MEVVNNSRTNDDDDDLEIPMLIKSKSTKLKSLEFANRQSFLFNNFKDIDVVESKPNKPSLSLNNDAPESNSLFKPFKEIDCVNKDIKSPISSSNKNEKKSEDNKEIITKKFFFFFFILIYD
jgi:hypothetical protein